MEGKLIMKKILIASHNENKVKEFRRLLPNFKIISLSDINDLADFEETGATFSVNSFLKANHYFQKHLIPTIADDSGLEVRALNNEPGINSKRYSGGDDNANNQKLLEKMKDIKDRYAHFKCVLTYYENDDNIVQFDGLLAGEIGFEIKGNEGFGYDPIFYIPSENKTLAELGSKFKDQNSHRARASQLFKEYLNENFSNK